MAIPNLPYQQWKLAVDFSIASLALFVLFPLIALIAIAIRICMGSPVLFKQKRPGLNERLFVCLKFRTMNYVTGEDGCLLPDNSRLTMLGNLLRRSSLDELPQLWNIVRGDLSFVGPRPLLEEYLPYYTHTEHRRHSVRPGLTGWAQIHGRNYLSFDERLALDIWYVDNISWKLDLYILLKTVRVVLSQKGITMPDGAAMTRLDAQRSLSTSGIDSGRIV
jgi:lipopolysaccharide/colanic/teichoic acid biosynthesis glycosyltransferase